MLRDHIVRGVTAGLVAGLVFGLFVAIVANPLIGVAETFEGGHADGASTGDHAEGHEGAAEHGSVVSAATTTLASIAGGVLWGVLLGAVAFGGAFYLLEPAIPGTDATKSYVLAAAGFVTVSGAPWLVLPPLAPGVEAAMGTTARLVLYGGAMLAGTLACALAAGLYRRQRDRTGRASALVAASLPIVALAGLTLVPTGGVAESALPTALETTVTGVVAFGQALLWAVLGASHARLHRGAKDDAASLTSAATTGDGQRVSTH